MTFDDALAYLLSLGHETLTIKLGLGNTEKLLAALNSPHRAFQAVQIAGTNGKGSTAVMLESICRAAGIRTGLFTSPHLISITERIRIDGKQISESHFARLTAEVKQTAEGLVNRRELQTLPTFFEHVTAIALRAFREAKVDLAILETGLGGRLDSTTAARADVVAITQIAMDHEEYLGHTIEEIAAEKAAIIRPGTTAVIGPQQTEALPVIQARCQEARVSPRYVLRTGESVTPGNRRTAGYQSQFRNASADGRCSITVETPRDVYQDVWLGLRGRHQMDNAVVAMALAESLGERGFSISRDAIMNGLKAAIHPGRLELWDGEPPILFDGAHNPAAAEALRDYLAEFVQHPITIIFGAMRDKRLPEIARALFPKAQQLVLTEQQNPRAATIKQLKAAVPDDFDRARVHEAKSIEEALQLAREVTNAKGLMLITGSLHLVGAAQQALAQLRAVA